ncbi:MAG: diaminopimelate epimerase [Pseudomonadota bacterium]
MTIKFRKMNGSGNDFVVMDARLQNINLTKEQIKNIASRDNATTKGCDQLVILRPSQKADVFMSIYNADSSEVDACGNATRCIADLLEKELKRLPVTIETNAAILSGIKKLDNNIAVDMGMPKFAWQEIPLAMPIEDAAKKVKEISGLHDAKVHFVNMGNPHVIFFVYDLSFVSGNKIIEIGAKIENSLEIFPERVNVTLAKYDDSNYIFDAKVWERGAGLTKACGTAACAMLAAANKENAEIKYGFIHFANSGERVVTEIEDNGHIILSGRVEEEFTGELEITSHQPPTTNKNDN